MDFNNFFSSFFASVLVVPQRIIQLIRSPYKTMRLIVQEQDAIQSFVILFGILLYAVWAYSIRADSLLPWTLLTVVIIQLYIKAVFFSRVLLFLGMPQKPIRSFFNAYSYTLAPTLLWFLFNSVLFVILPPPRTFSLLGRSFTIFYFTFGILVLSWKIILEYLATRFVSKLSPIKIVYAWMLFLVFLLPYMYLVYQLQIVRLPLI